MTLPIWVKHDISKTKNPGKMTEEELLALYKRQLIKAVIKNVLTSLRTRKYRHLKKPHNRNPIFPRASKHLVLPNRKENHLLGEWVLGNDSKNGSKVNNEPMKASVSFASLDDMTARIVSTSFLEGGLRLGTLFRRYGVIGMGVNWGRHR